jgi:hypothetical protein
MAYLRNAIFNPTFGVLRKGISKNPIGNFIQAT